MTTTLTRAIEHSADDEIPVIINSGGDSGNNLELLVATMIGKTLGKTILPALLSEATLLAPCPRRQY